MMDQFSEEERSFGKRALPFLPDRDRSRKRSRYEDFLDQPQQSSSSSSLEKSTNSSQTPAPQSREYQQSYRPQDPRAAAVSSRPSHTAASNGQYVEPTTQQGQNAESSTRSEHYSVQRNYQGPTNLGGNSGPGLGVGNQVSERAYQRGDERFMQDVRPQQNHTSQNHAAQDGRYTRAQGETGDRSWSQDIECESDENDLNGGVDTLEMVRQRPSSNEVGGWRRNEVNDRDMPDAMRMEEGKSNGALSGQGADLLRRSDTGEDGARVPGRFHAAIAGQATREEQKEKTAELGRMSLKEDVAQREGQQAAAKMVPEPMGGGRQPAGAAAKQRTDEGAGGQQIGKTMVTKPAAGAAAGAAGALGAGAGAGAQKSVNERVVPVVAEATGEGEPKREGQAQGTTMTAAARATMGEGAQGGVQEGGMATMIKPVAEGTVQLLQQQQYQQQYQYQQQQYQQQQQQQQQQHHYHHPQQFQQQYYYHQNYQQQYYHQYSQQQHYQQHQQQHYQQHQQQQENGARVLTPAPAAVAAKTGAGAEAWRAEEAEQQGGRHQAESLAVPAHIKAERQGQERGQGKSVAAETETQGQITSGLAEVEQREGKQLGGAAAKAVEAAGRPEAAGQDPEVTRPAGAGSQGGSQMATPGGKAVGGSDGGGQQQGGGGGGGTAAAAAVAKTAAAAQGVQPQQRKGMAAAGVAAAEAQGGTGAVKAAGAAQGGQQQGGATAAGGIHGKTQTEASMAGNAGAAAQGAAKLEGRSIKVEGGAQQMDTRAVDRAKAGGAGAEERGGGAGKEGGESSQGGSTHGQASPSSSEMTAVNPGDAGGERARQRTEKKRITEEADRTEADPSSSQAASSQNMIEEERRVEGSSRDETRTGREVDASGGQHGGLEKDEDCQLIMNALLQERLDLNPTRDVTRMVRWEEVYELSAGALQEEIEKSRSRLASTIAQYHTSQFPSQLQNAISATQRMSEAIWSKVTARIGCDSSAGVFTSGTKVE
ncbi:hypothetical protein GUITHDRAFT_108059 [Guillardia theta CCMP2712]|uniref:Uncharacterized protein n=1 Tax=Guillardia theta (strain CCMP2712) TaxID=905079 RepID=L1JD38_GUITC|nr:hypothetical protein GUITHDRAFT_108059 [Guillardia theta CCMP2712]EKX46020.1 hypothetical protein GUITHDRAFT_108059 [Guillardia theta CCMP2712]|eukprot:XP_005833000.1 hypothetical protein GUITHDRAFT_108059 [Guillardia theta CCMP2712]